MREQRIDNHEMEKQKIDNGKDDVRANEAHNKPRQSISSLPLASEGFKWFKKYEREREREREEKNGRPELGIGRERT